ncbi:MAG: hypothetical protein MJ231_07420, partial [bacterium]|nr:hypothetical protein [bacterium]
MFVDLFDIKNVFVQNKIGNEWEKSTYNNGKYGTDDTQIYADKNNRLYICSIKEAPARIKFEWNTKLSGKALILNDHWERSYGDIGWSHINTDKILPWYFAINQDNSTQFIGVMTQPNAFIHWQCTFDKISMIADLRCGGNNTILGGRTVEICKIVTFFEDADPFDGLSHFCSLMCQNPKMPLKPVYGGNDWYCSYGNNSHDRILLQAQRISECAGTTENRPYMVIDDGWQIAHGACVGFNGGPWRYCNSKLGDMQRTAQDIKSVGAIPGLWFRPLQTCEYMPKECYIERTISNNRLLRSLDPTHPTVKKYIVSEIQNMVNNGYKLLKHDYSSWDISG